MSERRVVPWRGTCQREVATRALRGNSHTYTVLPGDADHSPDTDGHRPADADTDIDSNADTGGHHHADTSDIHRHARAWDKHADALCHQLPHPDACAH